MEHILTPVKKQVLQKAEMSSSFPKDPFYGSQEYDGFIFEHRFVNQGIEKIATIFEETTNETQTGNLINATAEGFRLELGYNTDIANINWNRAKDMITDSWYKESADFIHHFNKKNCQRIGDQEK